MFRVLFFVFVLYIIYILIRFYFMLSKARKTLRDQGYGRPGGPGAQGHRKEKDISRVARVVDEKRLDEKD